MGFLATMTRVSWTSAAITEIRINDTNLSRACQHHLVITLSYAFKFCFMNSVSFSPTLLSCFSTFLFSLHSFYYTFVCTTLTTTSIFGNSAFIRTGIWDSFLLRSKRKVSAAEFVCLPKYKREMKCREGIQKGNEEKCMSAKNCKCSGFICLICIISPLYRSFHLLYMYAA